MGWIACVCCEKFRRDFVAQTFCTSTACFAPSFVRQPNSHQCTQIVQNARKHQFTVKWGGSDVFIAKNSDATSWHELLHYFRPFCTEFRKENKWPRMPQNVGFGSNGMDRLHSLQKIPTRLRGPNFCTSSSCFVPRFARQPKDPESTQIVRNAPKRQFRVQRGGSGAFVAKNSETTSWHELLH